MARKLIWVAIIATLSASDGARAQTPTQSDQDDKPQNVQLTKGPRIEHVDTHGAVIAWSTNVSAGTMVHYGTARDHFDKTAQVPWGGLTHRITLSGLQPDTDYYFTVESNQGQGTGTAASQAGEFHTPAEGGIAARPNSGVQVQAGPIVQNRTDRSAAIWWETNRPAETALRVGTDPQALQPAPGAQATSEQDHRVELTNLKPETTYYVAIAAGEGAQDTTHFRTEPAHAILSGQVRITNGPVIEYLDDKSAMLAWSTNQRSSTVVHYGTNPHDLNQTADGAWAQGTHRVELKDLKPSTSYYFAVESAQAQGGRAAAKSTPAPFQTTARGEAALRISMQK